MKKLVIDIDLDDTVADFFGAVLKEYIERTGDAIVREDITSWDLSQCVKHHEVMRAIFYEPGFFRGLVPLAGAVSAVSALVDDGHEVHIISSACTPHAYGEKAEWCRQWLPFIPLGRVNISHYKGRYTGDVLIDDGAHNAKAYAANNPDSERMGIAMPHNTSSPDFTFLGQSYRDPLAAWVDILNRIREVAEA